MTMLDATGMSHPERPAPDARQAILRRPSDSRDGRQGGDRIRLDADDLDAAIQAAASVPWSSGAQACRLSGQEATSGLLAQGDPGPAGDYDLPETCRRCREVQERRFSSSIRTRLVGAASPQRQSTRLRSVDEAPRAKDGTRSAA